MKIYRNILLFVIFSAFVISAQGNQSVRIIYNNDNLRDLAEQHFGDPDLWTTILSFNELQSAADLRAGMELQIPAQLVRGTLDKIALTRKTITTASSNGAKIFTPEILDSSIIYLNMATTQSENEEWERAFNSADRASEFALQSLEQSQMLRNQAADATISYLVGNVQSRRPNERVWKDAELFTKLYERDRARTLSESYAEITFIDLNRVRLNENSQALIQRSKIDLLKSKTDSKVKLTKGEAFAYLAKSPKRNFDIDLGGIETKIMSKHFWIQKADKSTMIANYEGKIEVKSEDSIVVLEENQGSTILAGGLPSEPTPLLPAPKMIMPENLWKSYSDEILFNWDNVEGAARYWFEIAQVPSFNTVVYSHKSLDKEEIQLSSLSPGIYYWHVCAVDEQGFPGKFDDYYILELLVDENKPFLRIESPAVQHITKEEILQIQGETEPDAQLLFNGEPLDLNADGVFNTEYTLKEGYNKLQFRAVDAAGNSTNYIREAIYEADPDIHLIVNNSNISSASRDVIFISDHINIDGITRAQSAIELTMLSSGKKFRAYSDNLGKFSFSFILEGDSEKAFQRIVSPAGYTRTDTLNFLVDKSVPVIQLLTSIPKQTTEKFIRLEGNVSGATELKISGNSVALDNDKFSYDYNLSPGENLIEYELTGMSGAHSNLFSRIIYDPEPPELVDYSIAESPDRKDQYIITIKAKDISGMKKWCKLNYSVKENQRELLLVLDNSSTFYERTVNLPGVEYDEIALQSVLLADYLGNEKKYNIK